MLISYTGLAFLTPRQEFLWMKTL